MIKFQTRRMPGLNEYISAERANRLKAAAMKKQWTDIVCWTAASCMERFEKPVKIRYHFYEKDRRRDKDNVSAFAHKVVQDGLVKAKVIPGDGWAWVTGWTDEFSVDPENPRVEITVEEV